MGQYALLLTSILYVITSISYCLDKKYDFAVAFLCYAIANIAFFVTGNK